MLTILATPKPFKGHIGVIQRNAIQSWIALQPRPQVILFADEEGTAETAWEFGVTHLPDLARNTHGTPLLDGVIREGRRLAMNSLVCYVNADIILTGAILKAIASVHRRMPKFLGVSKRINIDIREPLRFNQGWEERLQAATQQRGTLASTAFIDIFVFPKSCYEYVPPFALGRPWFDHWFIKAAHNAKMPVVELTEVAPLIHQNHDYAHVDGGMEAIWKSQETQRNLELYGKVLHDYTMEDATHTLRADGEIATRKRKRLSLREAMWELLVVKTFPMRKRLGLRRG